MRKNLNHIGLQNLAKTLQLNRDQTIIAVDGVSGTGKTVFTECLQRVLSLSAPTGLVGMDFDIIPRDEREKKDPYVWCPGEIAAEAIAMHLGGFSGSIRTLMYSHFSGKSDSHKNLFVPSCTEGRLIIEGVTSHPKVLEAVTRITNGTGKLVLIIMDCDDDIAYERRFRRDVTNKNIPVPEQLRRMALDRSFFNDWHLELRRIASRYGSQIILNQ